MVEHLKHIEWANFIPFMLATGLDHPKVNVSRMLETLIIGVIVAGLTVWSTQQVMEKELIHIKAEVKRIETTSNVAITALRTDIKALRDDLYVPAIRTGP